MPSSHKTVLLDQSENFTLSFEGIQDVITPVYYHTSNNAQSNGQLREQHTVEWNFQVKVGPSLSLPLAGLDCGDPQTPDE